MTTCSVCDGFGRISCGVCWGSQTKILCMGCSGRGYKLEDEKKITCTRCSGTKFFTPLSCPVCDNSVPCDICDGTGKTS